MIGGRCGGWVFGALWLLLLCAPPALATHEADHRFIVYGTVRDDHGRPVPDAKVIVVDPRVDQGMTAFTGSDGDYEALLHLHNADLGDEITVTALDQKKTVRAEFDPNDKTTPRKARVDFGAAPSEAPGSKGYGAGAVLGAALIIVAAAVALHRRRRRKGSATQKGRKKGR